jgi:hypothetical protein
MLLGILFAYLSVEAERKAAATASASVMLVFGGGGLLVLMRSRTLLRQGHTWQGSGLLVCGLLLLWITWWVCSRI